MHVVVEVVVFALYLISIGEAIIGANHVIVMLGKVVTVLL